MQLPTARSLAAAQIIIQPPHTPAVLGGSLTFAGGGVQMLWVNGNGRMWGDQHTSSGVACAQLPPKGADTSVAGFPRKWADVKSR